ncbi:GNAT family N-acetyltransferase [Deinococcus hohokamensis]|uniref:GNAT family N-acetyltransferase n=1 Tax=Deinococcus hohokamensis TaxID=309883 RepID=A0ABV9IDU1_9DEIO
MPVQIRPAQTFDAAFAAPLIQATIGAIGRALTGTETDEDASHVLTEFFPLRGHRLSFTHTLIAEAGGQPAGLLVAYPGDLAPDLDALFRDHRRTRGLPPVTEPEGQPGELYLDTLAVIPAQRGQGLGTALLEAAAQRAAARGLDRLGLLVEEGNSAARLYGRQGFRAAGVRVVAGRSYTHLVLPLDANGPRRP